MIETWVYPRVCGGTTGTPISGAYEDGLSPRVRGNLMDAGRDRLGPGSIPACAGEPLVHSTSVLAWAVYPRVCGGTSWTLGGIASSLGLSPRVRGNRLRRSRVRVGRRSIPACAGEPSLRLSAFPARRVYPRVCGGTLREDSGRARGWGLSPRVRGNLRCDLSRKGDFRSIPACAGEPAGCPSSTATAAVFPRVCGGTTLTPPPLYLVA